MGADAAVSAAAAPTVGAGVNQVSFSYTGAVQTFVVPPAVYALTLHGMGGTGGWGGFGWYGLDGSHYVRLSVGAFGGHGAVVDATVYVNPGDRLDVWLGGRGGDGGYPPPSRAPGAPGDSSGWPLGTAAGGAGGSGDGDAGPGGGGGGATGCGPPRSGADTAPHVPFHIAAKSPMLFAISKGHEEYRGGTGTWCCQRPNSRDSTDPPPKVRVLGAQLHRCCGGTPAST